MKLCRYGKEGSEKPGVIDAEGKLRDLSKIVPELTAAQLAPRELERLAKISAECLSIGLQPAPHFARIPHPR